MNFDFSDFFEEYLNFVIFLFPFVTQLGIPLGLTFFVVWRGSIISSPIEFIFLAFIFGVVLLVADLIAYFIGKKYGKNIVNYVLSKKGLKNKFHKSSKLISKNSFLSIILSRTLVLGLAPVTNYLLGYHKLKLRTFLFYVFICELIYSFLFMGLGYFFSETWEWILKIIQDFSFILIVLFISWFIVKHLHFHIKKHY